MRRQGKLVARKVVCFACGVRLTDKVGVSASAETSWLLAQCVKKVFCQWKHLYWSTDIINIIKHWNVTHILQSDWTARFHVTTQVDDSSDTRPFHVDAKGWGGQTNLAGKGITLTRDRNCKWKPIGTYSNRHAIVLTIILITLCATVWSCVLCI